MDCHCVLLNLPFLLLNHAQVAVKMAFIKGTAVADDSNMLEGDTDDLCDALVFLAKQGFIYTDVRPQNVLRAESDGRIRLIDYDDMKIVRPTLVTLKKEYQSIAPKPSETGFGAWVAGAISVAISKLETELQES